MGPGYLETGPPMTSVAPPPVVGQLTLTRHPSQTARSHPQSCAGQIECMSSSGTPEWQHLWLILRGSLRRGRRCGGTPSALGSIFLVCVTGHRVQTRTVIPLEVRGARHSPNYQQTSPRLLWMMKGTLPRGHRDLVLRTTASCGDSLSSGLDSASRVVCCSTVSFMSPP